MAVNYLFNKDMNTFGDWLRSALNAKGMSNSELARRAELSKTYVGNLIRNYSPNMIGGRAPRPSEEVVERIAAAVGAELNDARNAAGYSEIDSIDDGLYSGLKKLSPRDQKLARRQIQAILDSFVPNDEDEGI